MKKRRFCHNSFTKPCFKFPKILVLLCVMYFKEKNVAFENLKKKIIFEYDTVM